MPFVNLVQHIHHGTAFNLEYHGVVRGHSMEKVTWLSLQWPWCFNIIESVKTLHGPSSFPSSAFLHWVSI